MRIKNDTVNWKNLIQNQDKLKWFTEKLFHSLLGASGTVILHNTKTAAVKWSGLKCLSLNSFLFTL
jgi:hypothetical protein